MVIFFKVGGNIIFLTVGLLVSYQLPIYNTITLNVVMFTFFLVSL